MKNKRKLLVASLLGALTVIIGAFGAHALSSILTADLLSTFHTGVNYQFFHVITMVVNTILLEFRPNKWWAYSFYAFFIGIVLFSGSLYVMSTLTATGFEILPIFRLITPLGGLFLIAGWGLLGIGAWNLGDGVE